LIVKVSDNRIGFNKSDLVRKNRLDINKHDFFGMKKIAMNLYDEREKHCIKLTSGHYKYHLQKEEYGTKYYFMIEQNNNYFSGTKWDIIKPLYFNVLIIDDDKTSCATTSNELKEYVNTFVAHNSDQAIQVITKENINLALVDININQKNDGITLANWLNSEYKTDIILISSSPQNKEELPFFFVSKSKLYNKQGDFKKSIFEELKKIEKEKKNINS
jgi:CheY-like chemotaxis protein